MQKSKNLVEAGFLIFFFIFEILALQISKNWHFSNLAIFWVEKCQNLEKKSKIQKSGLYKFFWFLFTVTMPKIRKFCWLLKSVLNSKGLFFAENRKFLAFEGSKNEKSSYFSQKMYLEADFWPVCSRKWVEKV